MEEKNDERAQNSSNSNSNNSNNDTETNNNNVKLISQLSNNNILTEFIDKLFAKKAEPDSKQEDDFGDDDYDNNTQYIPNPNKAKPSRMAVFLENQKYTWAKEGRTIITKDTISFSHKDKKILKTLLLSSIPEDLRKDYWFIACGAKREKLNNPGYYKSLTANYPDKYIPTLYEHQITLDLNRTFPKDPFFKDPNNISKLRNILLAYSRRNITVGYSQGFNFIVGKILKIVSNEEDTFWIFTQLIESILPIDYYCEAAGIMVDCAILLRLLWKNNKDIMEHLSSLGYEMSINNVLFKWLLSLFIQNTSEKVWQCIWDHLLLEGHIVLFKAAVGFLKIMSKEITNIYSLEAIMKLFDEQFEQMNAIKKMKYYLIVKRFDFDMDMIDNNRSLFFPKVSNSIKKIPLIRAKGKKNEEECNAEFPYCLNNRNEFFSIKDYFIYKTLKEPLIINNYFFNEQKGHITIKKNHHQRHSSTILPNHVMNIEVINEEDCIDVYYHLMIERQKHICNRRNNIKESKVKEKYIRKSKSSVGLKLNKIIDIDREEKKEEGSPEVKENETFEYYKYEYSMNL